MKKLICLLLLASLNAQSACDWKTGITPGPNKTFVYSEECHQAVGALIQSNKDLTSGIQLKDLALKASDERALLWNNTSKDLEDRLQKVDSTQKKSDWLYFGLGALTVIGAGFMTARLIGH